MCIMFVGQSYQGSDEKIFFKPFDVHRPDE